MFSFLVTLDARPLPLSQYSMREEHPMPVVRFRLPTRRRRTEAHTTPYVLVYLTRSPRQRLGSNTRSLSRTHVNPSCEIRTLLAIYNWRMPISARNRLKRTVEEVGPDTVMAHVVVRVGDNLMESAITRRSTEEMHLAKGDTVRAIIKSTELRIQKD